MKTFHVNNCKLAITEMYTMKEIFKNATGFIGTWETEDAIR